MNACGVDDFHDGVNYMRTACVIAVSRARDMFEPFVHQVPLQLAACQVGIPQRQPCCMLRRLVFLIFPLVPLPACATAALIRSLCRLPQDMLDLGLRSTCMWIAKSSSPNICALGVSEA